MARKEKNHCEASHWFSFLYKHYLIALSSPKKKIPNFPFEYFISSRRIPPVYYINNTESTSSSESMFADDKISTRKLLYSPLSMFNIRVPPLLEIPSPLKHDSSARFVIFIGQNETSLIELIPSEFCKPIPIDRSSSTFSSHWINYGLLARMSSETLGGSSSGSHLLKIS